MNGWTDVSMHISLLLFHPYYSLILSLSVYIDITKPRGNFNKRKKWKFLKLELNLKLRFKTNIKLTKTKNILYHKQQETFQRDSNSKRKKRII